MEFIPVWNDSDYKWSDIVHFFEIQWCVQDAVFLSFAWEEF